MAENDELGRLQREIDMPEEGGVDDRGVTSESDVGTSSQGGTQGDVGVDADRDDQER
jgi:hypothetical protein